MNDEIVLAGKLIKIIEASRQNALKKVNEELIHMYWQIGEFLSNEASKAAYGDSYIDAISEEIQKAFPGIKGFTRRGLYRMKKFYETYKDDEIVTTVLSQLGWPNHWKLTADIMNAICFLKRSYLNQSKNQMTILFWIHMYWNF